MKQYELPGPRLELQIRELDVNSNRDAAEGTICFMLYRMTGETKDFLEEIFSYLFS